MSWTKENDAHYALYKFTRLEHFLFANANGQIASFEDVGEWLTSFCINGIGASTSERRSRAEKFVIKFNEYLFDGWNVKFETNNNLDTAITTLVDRLIASGSKLSSCGDAVDQVYNFPKERV